MINILHLLWIAPICAIVGIAFDRICIHADLCDAVINGKPFVIAGYEIRLISSDDREDDDDE